MAHSLLTSERDSLSSVLLGLLPSNVRQSVYSRSSSSARSSSAAIPRPPSAGSIAPPRRVLRCNRIFRRLRSSLWFWLQSWPFTGPASLPSSSSSLRPVSSASSTSALPVGSSPSRQGSFDRRSARFFPRSPAGFSCLRKPHPLVALLLLALALISLWDVEFVVEIGDARSSRQAAAREEKNPNAYERRGRWGFGEESLRHPTSWSSSSSFHGSSAPLLSQNSPLLYPSLALDQGNHVAAPMRARLLGLAAQSLVEKQWQPEPHDLWEEPPEALQWRPCALGDSSSSSRHGTRGALDPPARGSANASKEGAASAGSAGSGGGGSSSRGSSSGEWEGVGPFFSVAAKGGLSQLRVAICNAAAVAFYLNATLLLPHFLSFSSASQFGEVFDADHFIASLAPQVRVAKKLPRALQSLDINIMGVNVTEKQFPREVPLQLFLRLVPLMKRVGLIHFHGFLNALASDPMPKHVQRLRCRCMFHALTFLPAIRATAQLAIQRLRSANGVLPRVQEEGMDGEDEAGKRTAGSGGEWVGGGGRKRMEGQVDIQHNQVKVQVKTAAQVTGSKSGQVHSDVGQLGSQDAPQASRCYVAAHIPFDAISAAYSLCSFTQRDQSQDEADEEAEQLRDIRRLLFPVLHDYERQGRLNAPDWYRRIGRCPVAPEEAAVVLAAMGLRRTRPVFLVGVSAHPCGIVLGDEGLLSREGGGEEEEAEAVRERVVMSLLGDGGFSGGESGGGDGEKQNRPEEEQQLRAQQEEQLKGQGRRWFNGCRRLEAFRALFPSLSSIDTLLSPHEIAPYAHSPLLLTALETIVASDSDLFLAADGSSQLAALVAGRRMYFRSSPDKRSNCTTTGCNSSSESGYQRGYRPSVRIHRAKLAEDLGGGKDLRAGEEWRGDAEEKIMEWEEVEERVREMAGESKAVGKRRVSRSVYRHPRDEACMCFGEDKGGEKEEGESEEGKGAADERGGGKEIKNYGLEEGDMEGGLEHGVDRSGVGRSGVAGSSVLRADGTLRAGGVNEMGGRERRTEKREVRGKRRVGKGGGGNGLARGLGLRGVAGGRGVGVGVEEDEDEGEGNVLGNMFDGVGSSKERREEEEQEIVRRMKTEAESMAKVEDERRSHEEQMRDSDIADFSLINEREGAQGIRNTSLWNHPDSLHA
ncbi:hypothetical protein CLOM_g10025 [Closterium sp. NIES-68]|nr:hypothetical protein CLOM_g10025 [Closterium sp. NIES-68]GJP58741.1 hypothetical protein CLOP_g3352 [Closterium sp. NIES-67]